MVDILPADLEMFLVNEIRAKLAERDIDAKVNRTEPDPGVPFPELLIVVRDDSGPDTWVNTSERAVGVSTIGGTRENPKPTADIARIVHMIVRGCARVEPGNPVSAVLESNGPYMVPEDQPHARLYSTFTLAVVGEPA